LVGKSHGFGLRATMIQRKWTL